MHLDFSPLLLTDLNIKCVSAFYEVVYIIDFYLSKNELSHRENK